MIRLWWAFWASLWAHTMKPGKRYGAESFRWNVQRSMIKERDGHRCQKCGTRHQWGNWLEVHHRERVADGGSYSPSNLVALCRDCHQAHHRGDTYDGYSLPAEVLLVAGILLLMITAGAFLLS